ncbi:hypothetical protein ASPFODRAFT_53643 [Aspergillus luchuensis CBS 106.47]|uniref:Uncharacterized protein n=1 Tax=Aspergillus luchuensis (strain CBS 106.47) TaxID=1137211 RepID=A0A1M3T0H6_ASPLC|nr:hypothetical protein ASPFODRAFT_53643 [Aspergillus luchuensis CBS 106.47]
MIWCTVCRRSESTTSFLISTPCAVLAETREHPLYFIDAYLGGLPSISFLRILFGMPSLSPRDSADRLAIRDMEGKSTHMSRAFIGLAPLLLPGSAGRDRHPPWQQGREEYISVFHVVCWGTFDSPRKIISREATEPDSYIDIMYK